VKKIINGLSISIVFAVVYVVLKLKLDNYFYLIGLDSLFPLVFLSYVLVLSLIGIYLSNPVSGLLSGAVSLITKHLFEISRIEFNGFPNLVLTKEILPPVTFENLNIILTPFLFSLLMSLYIYTKGRERTSVKNYFTSFILLLSIFTGIFLNYYYGPYSLYVLPLASFIIGLISLNVVLSFTSGIFLGVSFSLSSFYFFTYKGDLNLMFSEPTKLLSGLIIYTIFSTVVASLSSFLFTFFVGALKGTPKYDKQKYIEKTETPALPQKEQSQESIGGEDEKVRDDGDIQT